MGGKSSSSASSSTTTTTDTDQVSGNFQGSEGQNTVVGAGARVTLLDGGAVSNAFDFGNSALAFANENFNTALNLVDRSSEQNYRLAAEGTAAAADRLGANVNDSIQGVAKLALWVGGIATVVWVVTK